MKNKIYLDSNATTGLDPRVLEAMLPELSSAPSNPSSVHFFGREAKARLQNYRQKIASYCKAKPQEILFTSGGTEGINLLIRGAFTEKITGHVITTDSEHSCIFNTLTSLQSKGLEVDFLPVGLFGAVNAEQIEQAIRPTTRFIILSAANNETGVKPDLQAIAIVAKKSNIPLYIDGVALLGKEPLEIPEGVSAMAFSGHKCHGPKGTGFLFLRTGTSLTPFLTGGEQEFHLRAGTENLPGIAGLSKAIELLHTELPEAALRMAHLRDHLQTNLQRRLDPVIVNGIGPRISNTCNLSFPGVQGEDLLIALDMAGIAVSHGSACSSGALEPSRILTKMGIPFPIARSAVRFSLSRNTTEEEIDYAVEILCQIVKRLK